MLFSIYSINILAYFLTTLNCQLVSLIEDESHKVFNFSFLVQENRKFQTFVDRCPLRIVGGIEAPISDVPYQISIRERYMYLFWYSFCGGTLITYQYVLSAAHCIQDSSKLSKIRVVAGTTKSQATITESINEHSRRVRNFYMHRRYDANTLEHDIAVLELQSGFIGSKSIKPIRMVSNDTVVNLKDKKLVLVSGYGLKERKVESPTLRMVCVPLISLDECSMHYISKYLKPTNFCAFGRGVDACQGDSGGPVVYQGVLVGIVSGGGKCGFDPGIYTRLASYTLQTDVPFVKRACGLRVTYAVMVITVIAEIELFYT